MTELFDPSLIAELSVNFDSLSEEEKAEVAKKFFEMMPGAEEEKHRVFDNAVVQKLGKDARENFSVEGYCAFYELVFGRKPPEHVREWVVDVFEAIESGEYLLIEAFRGSTKSTTFICFLAFFMGHNPERTNLVIGSGDDDANEIVDMVAKIITDNPGWKISFPHVVKDDKGHWGSGSGYDIVDNRQEYGKFVQEKQRHGRASSVVGVGYKSQYLPGPHPTGVLIVDDIYNEQNTTSEREMRKIEDTYNGTILAMLEPETLHVLIGTPWTETDLIAKKKRVKTYRHIFTPIVMPDGTPVWPEKFPLEIIEKIRVTLDDDIQYYRMYELNLEKLKGLTLKRTSLRWYDYQKIEKFGQEWPTFIGVDYTSTEDPTRTNVDYFAMAVGKLLPGNVAGVIVDGIRVRLEQAEAEGLVVEWAVKYPFLHPYEGLGIESVFSGRDFHNMMLGNMQLVRKGVVPVGLRGGVFQKSKGYRFEKVLQPAFQRAEIYLSDIYRRPDAVIEPHTREFFEAYEDEWAHWQGDKLEKLYHNDTLDAAFNVYFLMSKHFDIQAMEDNTRIDPTNPMYPRKEKSKNMFITGLTGR